MVVKKLMELLKDQDVTVRLSVFQTLLTLTHVQCDLILPHFKVEMLPVLSECICPNDSLIRVVDLGPFKHRIDDGLPIRRICLQIASTILDQCDSSEIQLFDVVTSIIRPSLNDPSSDLEILSFDILNKISQSEIWSSELLLCLDSITNDLMLSLRQQLKLSKDESHQISSRAYEVLRIAITTILSILKINGIQRIESFITLWERIKKTELLQQMLKEEQQQIKI